MCGWQHAAEVLLLPSLHKGESPLAETLPRAYIGRNMMHLHVIGPSQGPLPMLATRIQNWGRTCSRQRMCVLAHECSTATHAQHRAWPWRAQPLVDFTCSCSHVACMRAQPSPDIVLARCRCSVTVSANPDTSPPRPFPFATSHPGTTHNPPIPTRPSAAGPTCQCWLAHEHAKHTGSSPAAALLLLVQLSPALLQATGPLGACTCSALHAV